MNVHLFVCVLCIYVYVGRYICRYMWVCVCAFVFVYRAIVSLSYTAFLILSLTISKAPSTTGAFLSGAKCVSWLSKKITYYFMMKGMTGIRANLTFSVYPFHLPPPTPRPSSTKPSFMVPLCILSLTLIRARRVHTRISTKREGKCWFYYVNQIFFSLCIFEVSVIERMLHGLIISNNKSIYNS